MSKHAGIEEIKPIKIPKIKPVKSKSADVE